MGDSMENSLELPILPCPAFLFKSASRGNSDLQCLEKTKQPGSCEPG
jgi:hypothetical protein